MPEEGYLDETGDLLSLIGEEAAPSAPAEASDEKPKRKRAAKKAKAEEPTSVSAPLMKAVVAETEAPEWVEAAHPVLESASLARERAAELLRRIDPALAEQLPEELPFPPEDDPFTRTFEEWEREWYAARESAVRVYLNIRMEFRRQLRRAASGQPHDLKPWAYWVFHGARPHEGEPVYGLTEERREELAWTYPGPATDFTIYQETGESGG